MRDGTVARVVSSWQMTMTSALYGGLSTAFLRHTKLCGRKCCLLQPGGPLEQVVLSVADLTGGPSRSQLLALHGYAMQCLSALDRDKTSSLLQKSRMSLAHSHCQFTGPRSSRLIQMPTESAPYSSIISAMEFSVILRGSRPVAYLYSPMSG